jgi:ABC-type glycerol-3-phosphate transport system permease component
MAAYALARLEVPLKRTLLMLILTTQMFPLVVLIIPLFVLMRNANLIGTYQGLVVAYLAFTVPLAIWIMRGFIVTIPEELEHAAMIDGATRVGAMFRVILPIAGPGLVATATLSFIAAWNEFMLALTFMNTEEKKTLPLVLQSFVGRGDTDWGAVMATSVIYTLPVVIFFLLLRKRLMLGMTAGAVKG